MRFTVRPLSALALIILGACGSITDPTSPSALQTAAPARPVILFVHGWNANASTWTTMINRFKQSGWQSSELSAFSYDFSKSNATTAALIANKVDSIRTATGAPQVTIITHSMGALSARYYVRNLGGDGKVASLVTLGGTNHGTQTALFCFQLSCREMVPNSSFITALNATDETWGTPRYATWWTPCDEVISPRSSALLSGATNTQTACIKHSQLHEDATVYAQVRDFVNATTPATVVAVR